MTGALWTFNELVKASGGSGEVGTAQGISGVSIDTRSLCRGDLFVALSDQRDGHVFVKDAFESGAAAAIVRNDYVASDSDGALIRVSDTLEGLRGIARAARRRLRPDAKVIAVTGSVGKTGTKDMLKACFSRLGATHGAAKSYNNHFGVPLTLARMAKETQFAIFEVGMNHSGEITPLTRLIRPHIAIITTVAPVHLEFFSSVEEIAEAKAEIFLGLEPGGLAVLNCDNEHFALLRERALAVGARCRTFGRDRMADVCLERLETIADASAITTRVNGHKITYRLGIPGAHVAENSLSVVAVLAAAGGDIEQALQALAEIKAAEGRGVISVLAAEGGSVLLIDETYNANPASMRAALASLDAVPRQQFSRRIAVLGDMLELGEESGRLHAELKTAIEASGADLVFASGTNMAALFEVLPADKRAAWSETPDGIRTELLNQVKAGDAVMIKGSLGSQMAPLAEALKGKFSRRDTE